MNLNDGLFNGVVPVPPPPASPSDRPPAPVVDRTETVAPSHAILDVLRIPAGDAAALAALVERMESYVGPRRRRVAQKLGTQRTRRRVAAAECRAHAEKRGSDIEVIRTECEAFKEQRAAESAAYRAQREADAALVDRQTRLVDRQIELERLKRAPSTRPPADAPPARKRAMRGERYDVAASVGAQPGAPR